MSFQLAFNTTDYNQGKSILVQDSSSDWGSAPANIVSVTFTITSLYNGVVLDPNPMTVVILDSTESFSQGFQYEITSYDFGFDDTSTVPDSIYNIVMTIQDINGTLGGPTNTYTSDEVVYYNAEFLRDNFIASQAVYIDSVYNKDMDYANWLDFLVTSIEANATSGNSTAIFYLFDIFDRLSS
jgi:predicted Zn-dependent peptidase